MGQGIGSAREPTRDAGGRVWRLRPQCGAVLCTKNRAANLLGIFGSGIARKHRPESAVGNELWTWARLYRLSEHLMLGVAYRNLGTHGAIRPRAHSLAPGYFAWGIAWSWRAWTTSADFRLPAMGNRGAPCRHRVRAYGQAILRGGLQTGARHAHPVIWAGHCAWRVARGLRLCAPHRTDWATRIALRWDQVKDVIPI